MIRFALSASLVAISMAQHLGDFHGAHGGLGLHGGGLGAHGGLGLHGGLGVHGGGLGLHGGGLAAHDGLGLHGDHGHHGGGYGDDYGPRPYAFAYGVRDAYHGTAYDQDEKQDPYGNRAGSYRVGLPDGRTQIVTYTASHKGGYMADVKYEPSYAASYGHGLGGHGGHAGHGGYGGDLHGHGLEHGLGVHGKGGLGLGLHGK